MNYGIHLSAGGALTSMYRQDVLANNLANLNTVGFKPHALAMRARDTARAEDGLHHMDSNDLLERLGGGVLADAPHVDFGQGPIRATGNDLDLAIEGDGFLAVASGEGADRIRLTRDGRLTLDSEGRLVQATTGARVLDAGDGEIELDPTLTITVDDRGNIRQDGEVVAELQFINLDDTSVLEKLAGNQFKLPQQALSQRTEATGRILQGSVEGSGVNPITALMSVQSAAGAARENLRMMSLFNQLMGQTINTFGRTS